MSDAWIMFCPSSRPRIRCLLHLNSKLLDPACSSFSVRLSTAALIPPGERSKIAEADDSPALAADLDGVLAGLSSGLHAGY